MSYGSIRKRPDGISEYFITGKQEVRNVLINLQLYLRIKKRQAELLLIIIDNLSKDQSLIAFLKLCELVDNFVLFNDSKKRTITTLVVKEELRSYNLFPVETED